MARLLFMRNKCAYFVKSLRPPSPHLELKTTLCYTIREIKLYVQLYSCMYNYLERIDQSQWNILARKITKIAREAEHLVLLAMRGDGLGTAEIDCIHAVRHHPGITQTELAAALNTDKPAIARRTASLERKGYLRPRTEP